MYCVEKAILIADDEYNKKEGGLIKNKINALKAFNKNANKHQYAKQILFAFVVTWAYVFEQYVIGYTSKAIVIIDLHAKDQLPNLKSVLFLVVIALIFYISLLRYAIKNPITNLRDFKIGKIQSRLVNKMLLIIGTVIAIVLLSLLIAFIQANMSHNQIPIPGNQQQIIKKEKEFPIMVAILSVIVAPVFEEVIFRRQIISFKNKKWLICTYIISCILFALAHIAGYNDSAINFIKYLVPGVFLGGIYVYTRDIKCSILTHMLYNSLAVLAICS